ncbi:alpha-1,2-fucosyltransferase [Bacteroidia bacterium]|nr:alpha-1,2-fucosyltransferase [Bacteroidia bacterium]
MEVILLYNGLGNQMFQYAFYLAKKKKNRNVVFSSVCAHRDSSHWGYELGRVFGVTNNASCFTDNMVRLIRKLRIFQKRKGFSVACSLVLFVLRVVGIKIVAEKAYRFDNEMMRQHSGWNFYFGHWITEKYFLHVREDVLSAFTFDRAAVSRDTATLLDIIENTDSVSIHVRRGDKVVGENKKIFDCVCVPQYVEKAIAEINKVLNSPVFFVFSDDIEWCQANLQIPNSHYCDYNRGLDSWQDMFLMSKCKHNIIGNSTFSWWGAWLNQNPQKVVIAPSRLLNGIQTPDYLPDEWIKL